MAEKWIAAATAKYKGALRRKLGAKKGKSIPSKKVNAAAKKGGKIGKEARLAKTLRKMKRKK